MKRPIPLIKKLIDVAIVSLQNPAVRSDEATQFHNLQHISINEAILSILKPPI
jgi:hypothetical protein